jgi:hypothetical protein
MSPLRYFALMTGHQCRIETQHYGLLLCYITIQIHLSLSIHPHHLPWRIDLDEMLTMLLQEGGD